MQYSFYFISAKRKKKNLLKKDVSKINKSKIVWNFFNPSAEELLLVEFEKLKKRVKIINYLLETKTNPEWMTIKYLPVLPPTLRPIVKLQDKTIIITELNSLYVEIININNKLIELKKMLIPETFLKSEIYFLQETVTSLIENTEKNKNHKRLLTF